MDTLIYLYGIAPPDAPDPGDELVGIEDRPVRLVRIGEASAIVSALPAAPYQDDALNAQLDDLAWVGARGVAHERVLDWFAERGPVIPLSLFSLHADAERLEARVRAEAGSFRRIFERLRGRKEWGIKLWRRDADAKEGVDALSPSLQALAREIEEAPPGKRFLLDRKRDKMRTEEVRAVSRRVTHELFASLGARADASATVPLPANPPAGERVLLLDAAYLVPDTAFGAFQEAVTFEAGRLAGTGFEIEFTGPWPPYHFATQDDE